MFPALLKSGPFSGRWLTPIRSVKDRLRSTKSTTTGRSNHNTVNSYTRVDDDTYPSIELGHRKSSINTDSEKSLIKPPQAAHRAHPSSRPPKSHIYAEPASYRMQNEPPSTGIAVQRDWTVDSTSRTDSPR